MQPCTTATIGSEATIIPPRTSVGDSERPAIMCEKDAVAIFLIEQKTCLYHNVLFAGYWDNYDNKLVSIVAEPYSHLPLTMAMTYII